MPKKTKLKLPKELTKVTFVSKTLAAILFIVLPFVFLYIGYQYGKVEVEPTECMVVDK
ncbi:hypothetical protein GW755_04450 [bacterium]|nr:hypothetical protein [bacterium]